MICPICKKTEIPEEYARCGKCKKMEEAGVENTQGLIQKDLLLD